LNNIMICYSDTFSPATKLRKMCTLWTYFGVDLQVSIVDKRHIPKTKKLLSAASF